MATGCVCRVAVVSLDYRAVAQLVEHRSPKPAVAGSSPSCPAGKVQVTGVFVKGNI